MTDPLETVEKALRIHERQRAKAGFAACFDNLARTHTPQEVADILTHEMEVWLEMNPKVKG